MRNQSAEQRQTDEIARSVITTIWRSATGMLGICIPLVFVSRSNLIPILVVVGAAFATAVVWVFTRNERKTTPDLAALEERVRKIDERLANVETISNFDRLLAEKSAATPSQGS